jgi:hypothetical protein
LAPLERRPEQARGVGQAKHEQPFPPVGCANFLRREESFRNPVTHAFQLASDLAITEVEMVGDVLQENKSGLAFADDAGDMGPEVAGVAGAASLAGDAKWLTRIARQEDAHRATPRAAVEGSKVVPDRSRRQGRLFHPGHEHGRREGVPLDIAHSTVSGLGDVEAEVEASGAGAEGKPEQRVSAASTAGGM